MLVQGPHGLSIEDVLPEDQLQLGPEAPIPPGALRLEPPPLVRAEVNPLPGGGNVIHPEPPKLP